MVKRLSLLAVALLTLASCVAGERHLQTYERVWPAAGVREIRLNGVDGDVVIESGSPNEIRLVAKVKSRGISPSKDAENGGYFQTVLEGDSLRIGQKKAKIRVRFPFSMRSRLEIDYALQVPETIALELRTVNGKISTRGVSGQAEMTLVNGTIDAEVGGENDFHATTVNGRIRAKFLRDFKGARLKTVNGGVEALLPPTASFTCSLSQVNGDFEASFPLSIHSHPGSRRVSGEVNGGQYQLQITTINGDVEVDRFGVTAAPKEPEVVIPEGEMPAPPPPPPSPVS